MTKTQISLGVQLLDAATCRHHYTLFCMSDVRMQTRPWSAQSHSLKGIEAVWMWYAEGHALVAHCACVCS